MYNQTPYSEDVSLAHNKYSCVHSLFEPQTFAYPSIIEDHFISAGRIPYVSNSILQMFTDNCCHFDEFVNDFSRDISCIDAFIVPGENCFC